MAEVALIVIAVLVFFAAGFAVGVRVVGIIGRWKNGPPGQGAGTRHRP